jgi:hypothetical protein
MSTASTAKPPAKRVRIDQDTPPVFNYTPIAGSVSTLLPVMKELVTHYYDKFIKISKNIFNKTNIIKKLQQPDFIPRSARSNFKIGASETLKLSNEYNQLVTNAAAITTAFEKQQKRNIIESAKLEKEVMEKQRNSIFIEGIHKISTMIYVWKTDKDDNNEAEIHHLLKDIINKDATILTHVFNNNYNEFATQYNIIYPLSTNIINPAGINTPVDEIENNELPDALLRETMEQYFPRRGSTNAANQQLHTQDTATVTTVATTTASTQDYMDDDEDIYETQPTHHLLHDVEVMRLLRILKDVFVTSWSTERHNMENKAAEVKITKYIKTQLITKATDEAAAIVEQEPAADMKQLQEIINKQINEHTKKLQKELQTTKQQLQRIQASNGKNTAKNSTRGEKNTRANENKSQTNQQRRRSTSTNRKNNNRPTQNTNQNNNNRNVSRRSNTRPNTNNNGIATRTRSRSRKRSGSNDSHSTNNRNNTYNRNQTPRRRNQRIQRNEKAEDAPRGTRANRGNRQTNNNNNRSTSRNRNSSTRRGRQRTQQN